MYYDSHGLDFLWGLIVDDKCRGPWRTLVSNSWGELRNEMLTQAYISPPWAVTPVFYHWGWASDGDGQDVIWTKCFSHIGGYSGLGLVFYMMATSLFGFLLLSAFNISQWQSLGASNKCVVQWYTRLMQEHSSWWLGTSGHISLLTCTFVFLFIFLLRMNIVWPCLLTRILIIYPAPLPKMTSRFFCLLQMISQACVILTWLMFLCDRGLNFSLLFFNTHSFVWMNNALAFLSAANKALKCLTCSCSSPWYCQQPCIHGLVACVHWMEWPHSLHYLNHSVFTLPLYMLFPPNFLVGCSWINASEMHTCCHSIPLFGISPCAQHIDFIIPAPTPYPTCFSALERNWRGPGQHSGSPGHVSVNQTLSPSRFSWYSSDSKLWGPLANVSKPKSA